VPNGSAPLPAPSPDDSPGLAAWRAIPLERWYRETAEANRHRCDHGGPCGQWFLCDRQEHRAGGYPTVEMLSRGTPGHAPGELIFHCEGPTATLRPGDLRYETRRAGLARRDDAR
jgi:hypothetical protein